MRKASNLPCEGGSHDSSTDEDVLSITNTCSGGDGTATERCTILKRPKVFFQMVYSTSDNKVQNTC